MSRDQRKRADRRELLIASAMVAVGLAISGVAVAQLRPGESNSQVAQATPPLQSTPGAETRPAAPADPSTTGASGRPSEVPPQPARPSPEAQKDGATAVLPPAPAEKTAAPIQDK
jgi:hypothetical protein